MFLKDDQKVALTAVFTSRAGNTVPYADAGTVTWESSDPNVLTVTDNGDGTAEATTTGVLGTATVTLRNDFNDDGTEDFQGSLAFDVIAGDVGGVTIGAGTPVSRFDDAAPPPAPEPTPEPLPEG